jgi:hypothetical protein
MTRLATQLRAVLLFYRSVLPFMWLISALIVCLVWLPARLGGWAGNSIWLKLLLIKLATAPAVWYLSERMRPAQYWLYYNMGVSRQYLWTGLLVLDSLFFLGVGESLNFLFV